MDAHHGTSSEPKHGAVSGSTEWLDVGGARVPVHLTTTPWPDPHLDPETWPTEADAMALNMGPQHPSTHGVLRLKLHLDGEVCFKCVPYVGYLHRGAEKILENKAYVQATPIVDKHDYVSPLTNEIAINMAFEALMEVEVPARARVLRTILAELQRLASHHIFVGCYTLDLGGALGGGASLFLYNFREREGLLDLFEELTGGRFHYNTICVGGNRHDVPAGWPERVKRFLDHLERRLDEYYTFTEENYIFHQRTKGVGYFDPILAMELGISGPSLRASGVDYDMRRDAPYLAYDRVKLQVPVRTEGDCFARFMVRIDEMRASIDAVRQLIDDIPEGPICAMKPVRNVKAVMPKAGSAYVAIESPRGEIGTYVVADGSERPYRVKIRPPSLHAVSALPYLCAGANVSDIVAILGSVDPILGEVDR